MRREKPVAERIKNVKDARRCIEAVAKWLDERESPLAAADLRYSIRVLLADASAAPGDRR